MIYTGWRPSELSIMTFDDGIDVEGRIMQGGLKTAAGRGRIVPICDKIFPFVDQMKNSGFAGISVDENGKILNYNKLYRKITSFSRKTILIIFLMKLVIHLQRCLIIRISMLKSRSCCLDILQMMSLKKYIRTRR